VYVATTTQQHRPGIASNESKHELESVRWTHPELVEQCERRRGALAAVAVAVSQLREPPRTHVAVKLAAESTSNDRERKTRNETG
jgi:hypothetical protein